MLGVSFLSFLMLTLIGAVVAVLYHDVLRYRFLDGVDARIGKLIVGWLGGWVGSAIFGTWLWRVGDVYIFPAILGALAAVHLNALLWKSLAKLSEARRAAVAGTKEEMRPKAPMAA